jgi:hypothetical protein
MRFGLEMPMKDWLWVAVQVALFGLYGALLLGTAAGEWAHGAGWDYP